VAALNLIIQALKGKPNLEFHIYTQENCSVSYSVFEIML
jgi:hypothetical protein